MALGNKSRKAPARRKFRFQPELEERRRRLAAAAHYRQKLRGLSPDQDTDDWYEAGHQLFSGTAKH